MRSTFLLYKKREVLNLSLFYPNLSFSKTSSRILFSSSSFCLSSLVYSILNGRRQEEQRIISYPSILQLMDATLVLCPQAGHNLSWFAIIIHSLFKELTSKKAYLRLLKYFNINKKQFQCFLNQTRTKKIGARPYFLYYFV